MTRETKVGLIVGLGFIVVFAVILSHKGGQPRATGTGDLGPLVDASPRVTGSSESSRNRSQHPGVTGTPRSDTRGPGHTTPVVGGGSRPQPGTSEPRVELPKSLTGTEAPSTPAPAAQPGGGRTHVPLPEMPGKGQADRGSEALSPSLKTWLDESPNKTDADADRMGATARRTAPPVAAPAPPPAPEVKPAAPAPRETKPAPTSVEPATEPKPRIKQEYIVKKGETLTRIAQSVYGKGTPREVEAIMKANRKEVPDAKRIRAGAKLIIPELPDGQFEAATFPPSKTDSSPPAQIALVTPSAGPGPETKESRGEQTAGTAKDTKAAGASREGKEANGGSDKPEKLEKSSNWRWYTVQEGETLAGIARKHLGSADRWKEIVELNKGRFRDPARVPAGAKIKLPSQIAGLSKL